MAIEYRAVRGDEIKAFYDSICVPFGVDPTAQRLGIFEKVTERDRLRAAFDGSQLVGTFGAFSLELTVPGGAVRTAGTTVVTVLPTHRRRGILRQLMTEHLEEIHSNGEPLAALWASEAGIYGRFGYGPATERWDVKIDKPHAILAEPVEIADRVRLITADEAANEFPKIHGQVAAERPGMYQRTESWWENRIFLDPPELREGETPQRLVLCDGPEGPTGYVIFTTGPVEGLHQQRVAVQELIALDRETEKTLWQFVCGIDLAVRIDAWNLPVDTSLPWWLVNSRHLKRSVVDALWVRPVDVVAALNARRYRGSGEIIFSFADELCPWNAGTYRLNVGADGIGRCEPTTGTALIQLSPFSLGAVYLGGHTFSDLARSGVISGSPEALAVADVLFGWHRRPWCHEVF